MLIISSARSSNWKTPRQRPPGISPVSTPRQIETVVTLRENSPSWDCKSELTQALYNHHYIVNLFAIEIHSKMSLLSNVFWWKRRNPKNI
jgi:hypothetical protein